MKVKEESERVGLKLNIQKTKIMASGPITPWQINGETMETVSDLIFLGSKTTPGGAWNHCNYKIKRRLLLGRKAMTNLESILKSRDITLPTKIHLVKAMVFPVVMLWMWELDYKESWAPKNSCFRIVVLEKTLENPLDSKEIKAVNPKGNQYWIFIAEAEAPMFLATWLEELPHSKRPWWWKRLRVREGGNRGQDVWVASLTQ